MKIQKTDDMIILNCSKKKRRVIKVSDAVLCLSLLMGGAYQMTIHTTYYKKLQSQAYDTLATIDKEKFRLLSNTKILDKDDKQIGEINSGNYVYEEISDIPLNLQNAYIATEDANFKYHKGIDYKAILRAGIALVLHGGKITQGGSTITQQVIKNNLLTQEQSFIRKLLEILMASEIEKEYSKQEIMEFYCNSNYYGNGCYGVGSASRFYFGKNTSELTLAECAMLAGVSNSPNNYNPAADYSLAVKKMKQVLGNMVESGYISEKEYTRALKQEITVTQTEASLVGTDSYMTSYAVHCATLELMEQDGFEFRYLFDGEDDYTKYSEGYKETYKKMASRIRGGGYTIRTSFDMSLQEKLQKAVDEKLAGDKERQENGKYQLQGAAVSIDNETGYIVAVVGGRGTEDPLNRGFLAERQPGSTIKPILVYAPAFDRGVSSPSLMYMDEPVNINGYAPQNATKEYMGSVSTREALVRSLNTIPVKIFHESGVSLSYMEKLEFSTLRYEDEGALSTALGGFSAGVRVDEMAKAYAALENHGRMTGKTCIRVIEHEKDGNIYDSTSENGKEVYSQDAAFMVTDCLQGVIEEPYGTAKGMNLKGQIAAGKTGTTDFARDVWMCGYTRYYTTAVWVGKDDNEILSGSNYANDIWEAYMNAAHEGKPVKDFEIPSTIQYRNVVDGGKLGEEVDGQLDTSVRTYRRRKQGYDLYSLKAAEKLQANIRKRELQKSMDVAESAVAAFEKLEISDVDSALRMNDLYAEAVAAVEGIPDSYKRGSFEKRVWKKRKRLLKTYENWTNKITELEKEEAKQVMASQTVADEANETAAAEMLHDRRISYMKTYLTLLSERLYNTDAAQQLLADAKACLDNCRWYKEYDRLSEEYREQEKRIGGLPAQIPDISENDADREPVAYPEKEEKDELPEQTSDIQKEPEDSPEKKSGNHFTINGAN